MMTTRLMHLARRAPAFLLLAALAQQAAACPGDGGPTCGPATPAPASQQATAGVNVGAGNPINVMTGNKYQREDDLPALPGVLGLEIVRHYNSRFSGPGAVPGLVGRGWKLSYETELAVSGGAIQVLQADGSSFMFQRDLVNPAVASGADPANGSIAIRRNRSGAEEYQWRWIDGRELSFDQRGKLVQIKAATGETVSLLYDSRGLLVKVTDPQGRSLRLSYLDQSLAARGDRFRGVQSIDSPVGRFTYEHGNPPPRGAAAPQLQLLANLVRVRYPAAGEGRRYHYEDAAHPTYLTGITVEGTDAAGKTLAQRYATFGYQADGRAVLSTHAGDADKVTLAYERPGLTVVTNSLGQRTEYRYATVAGDYRLVEARGAGCALCGPANERYGYDKLGRLAETVRLDAHGAPLESTRTEHDYYGRPLRVSRVAYRDGRAGEARLLVRYEYGAVGAAGPTLLARPSVVPGREAVTRIAYGSGNAAQLPVAVSENGYAPGYDAAHAAYGVRRSVAYRYSEQGRLIETDGPLANAERNPGPANSDISLVEYDAANGLPRKTTAPGNIVTEVLERDQALRPVRARVSDGYRITLIAVRYNWRGQPLEVAQEAYLADASGQPDPATRMTRSRQFSYSLHGRLASTSTGGVLATTLVYDEAGRLVQRILPDGSRVAATLDGEGHRLSEQRYAGETLVNTIRFGYDGMNRLAQVDDLLGAVRRNSYDAAGQLELVRNGLSIATRYAYDADGLLQERTDADGSADAAQTRLRRDMLGQATTVTAPNGVATERRYDDFGHKIMEANADRGVTLYRYDAAGRLLARTDDTGNIARFRYDHANRLVALGSGAQEQLTQYRYQGLKLVEVISTTDENPAHAAERTRYRYDALGQVVEESQWLARVEAHAGRNAALRNVALAAPAGIAFVTRSSYDSAGRLTGQVLPDGHTVRYDYAGPDGKPGPRLRAVLFDGQPVVADIEQSITGGVTAYTAGNGVHQRIGYDARGRVLQLRASAGQRPAAGGWWGALLARLSGESKPDATLYLQDNSYDAGGRLSAARRTQAGQALDERYEYDSLNRLTAVLPGAGAGAGAHYAYDSGGNRILTAQAASTRYGYAPDSNRLLAASSGGEGNGDGGAPLRQTAWLYHASGVPLAQVAGGAAWRDALGSLRIAYSAGRRPLAVHAANGKPVARYVYGSLGQRVAKTVYDGAGTGRTTYSLYSEQRLSAEADEDGRIVAHYLYLYGKPVAKIDIVRDDSALRRLWRRLGGAAGEGVARVYAVQTDHLGVPQMMTDGEQRIVWQARSDAFGAATVSYAATRDGRPVEMKLRLPGQVYDPETGLHQNYYRDYDPRTGRYLTPDPMGLEGGLNPYAYAGSNPLGNIDPLGLYEIDIHYYTTFVLALAAGLSKDDARMLALGTQFVDNNPLTEPMPDGVSPSSMRKNAEALLKYHFVLPGGTGDADIMNPSSTQLSNLENAAVTAMNAGNRNACLQFAGEFLHAFEDTFSHRDYNNVSFDPVKQINVIQWGFVHLTVEQKNLGIGHGLLAHDPDYTYNHHGNEWGQWTPANGGTVQLFIPPHDVNWDVSELRTLNMEEAAFKKLLAYGDPSKAKSWSDLRNYMMAFNAIDENEDNTSSKFTRKLAKLDEMLRALNITGIQLTGADAYDRTTAEDNRQRNLNGLKQEDYVGTILR